MLTFSTKMNYSFSAKLSTLLLLSTLYFSRCAPQYPVFVPTNEFQRVPPGYRIPPGLHVKMNLATGEKFAKLISSHPDYDSFSGSTELILQDHNTQTFLRDIDVDQNGIPTEFGNAKRVHLYHSDDQEPQSQEPKVDNHPQEDDEARELLKVNPADFARMNNLIETLSKVAAGKDVSFNNSALESADEALNDLEDIVHDYSIGIKLVESNGFDILVDLLKHGKMTLSKKAALVLGSSVQNNPSAQKIAFQKGLLVVLLELLDQNKNVSPSNEKEIVSFHSRLFYTLSSLIRGAPRSSHIFSSFSSQRGLDILGTLYSYYFSHSTQDSELFAIRAHAQKKCLGVIGDFFSSALDIQNGDNLTLLSNSERDIWCQHLQDTLLSKAYDNDISVYEQAAFGLAQLQNSTISKCSLRKHVLSSWVKNQLSQLDKSIWEGYFLSLQQLQNYL